MDKADKVFREVASTRSTGCVPRISRVRNYGDVVDYQYNAVAPTVTCVLLGGCERFGAPKKNGRSTMSPECLLGTEVQMCRAEGS